MARLVGVAFLFMFSIISFAQVSPSQTENPIGAATAAGKATAGVRESGINRPEKFDLIPDISYFSPDGIELKADLYLPQGPGPFAGAVFIHGGGWSSGDRKQLKKQAEFLASHGVVGMAIEYRLSHQAKYPEPLNDSREAVRWLRRNAARYRIDSNRIFAVGSSAGGYLACMLGLAPSDPESRVEAVIAFNPVLDLTRMQHQEELVENLLGKPCSEVFDLCKQASPLLRVSPASVPFLILHGSADQTVPYQHAIEMVTALKSAGVQVELFTAEGGEHAFWAKDIWRNPTDESMARFLRMQRLLSVPAQ